MVDVSVYYMLGIATKCTAHAVTHTNTFQVEYPNLKYTHSKGTHFMYHVYRCVIDDAWLKRWALQERAKKIQSD